MGHTMFATSVIPARSRAAAAVPVSLGVHAAAVSGLLALPLLGGAAAPPVPVRAAALPPIAIALPRPAPALPLAAHPPASRSGRSLPERPLVETPPTRPVPTAADIPPLAAVEDHGSQCAGCALSNANPGPGAPGPAVPGDGAGPATGTGAGPAPLVVGRQVTSPAKLRHVDPEYPDLARRVGVQGTVVIECVIDAEGRVSEMRTVRSIPLLDAAALAAVKQWRYRPTLLSGVAVPVVMTVTVNFHLR